MQSIPVFELPIPEYHFREGKPDVARIGSLIANLLRKQFDGQHIAFRLVGSAEHPGKTADELIRTIQHLGHDRYDPKRAGDRYQNIEGKRIDFFALDFEVGNAKSEECIGWALDSFYEWPLKDRQAPVRVDIGIVYDIGKLDIVEHTYAGRETELKKDGFVFKHPESKPNAILGIIKMS